MFPRLSAKEVEAQLRVAPLAQPEGILTIPQLQEKPQNPIIEGLRDVPQRATPDHRQRVPETTIQRAKSPLKVETDMTLDWRLLVNCERQLEVCAEKSRRLVFPLGC
jgi:hypothetical protein